MTKKDYIIPSVDVLRIETASIVAQSFKVDKSSDNAVYNEEEVLARRHNDIWDDEEEEEEEQI